MSKSSFSQYASAIVILFVCCFPVAIDLLDNQCVGTTSNSHFLIPAFGQRQLSLPQLNDEALRVELVIEELLFPTSMVFVDNDTLLVTQKNNGNVISITNGKVNNHPATSVEVNNEGFKGLLGIAAMEKPSSSSHTKFVFLYFTESLGEEQTRNRVEYTDMNGTERIKYW